MKETEQEMRKFSNLMLKASKLLPSNIDLTEQEKAIRTQEFWKILKDFSIKTVESAFDMALRRCRFFPAPVELLQFCEEAAETFSIEGVTVEFDKGPIKLPQKVDERMSAEEAKKALNLIFDRLGVSPLPKASRGKKVYVPFTDEQVADRKRQLKKQAKILEGGAHASEQRTEETGAGEV